MCERLQQQLVRLCILAIDAIHTASVGLPVSLSDFFFPMHETVSVQVARY
jgi:hypothetical protein